MATLTTLNAASPLDASDNTYLTFTTDTDAETLSRALDNVDADFLSMDTLTHSVEYSLTGANDDDVYDLSIRIVNGATILAAADSGGTFATVATGITTTTDTTSTATSFAYVNTTASRADWDGASVELQQGHTKNKGGDNVAIQVDLVTIDGTYTQATSVDLLADDVESSTEVSSPAITQEHGLTSTDSESSTEVTTNDITQEHVLDATDPESSTEVTAPAITQDHQLTRTDSESASEVSTPALTEENALTVVDVESSTEVTSPALAEEFFVMWPNADTSIGSWTDQAGGTTNLYTRIDDWPSADDADYVRSELNPTNSAAKFALRDPGSVDAAAAHNVKYRYYKEDSGGQQIDLTVRLVQGASTVIATWTHLNIGGTVVEAQQSLSAGEISSITDYTALHLEFEANAP